MDNLPFTVLLVGARGMLARAVIATAPAHLRLIERDLPEFDITDPHAVTTAIAALTPRVLLNCAAYIAVDKAETERALAYAVNADGARNLAAACRTQDVPLVHISTDFVFSGDGSHLLTEEDVVAPRGVYAESKRAGELAVEHSGAEWLIVRTSWLYAAHGGNFPNTMLRLAAEREELKVVSDQRGCPTFARDLATALWRLIACNARGYVHVCNSDVCSWYEFACAIVHDAAAVGLLPRAPRVTPISSAQFNSPAPRPAFSAMATARYTALTGAQMRPWREALQDYVQAKRPTQ